jgi:hypothetical protein
MVTDLSGGSTMLDSGDILASNENLHPQMLHLLKSAGRGARPPSHG